ncbi:MAG: tetratricopeptide repeat protein [Mastigocoleus sp.]
MSDISFPNLFSSNYIATAIVSFSAIALLYFAIRTLITSNRFQRGMNLYQEKDYQGAEAAFRKVIDINSTNDVVHLFLGECLMYQERVDEAIAEFESVIDRAPKKADAYLRLSDALMQKQKPKEAIANLQKAKELLEKQRQPQQAEKIENLLEKIGSK